MKKISIFLAVTIMIVSMQGLTPAAAVQSEQLPFELLSEGAYMENLETGRVMVSKNADQRFAPASLTKIMTGILALENIDDLDNETARLKIYLNDMIYGTGAKTGGFWPGDEATIRDVLYDTLIYSAAECALMLADYVGDGSVEHFVDMMNDRAKELGCTDTNFTDPHGLDETQYTTPRDMAIIAKHAMSIPAFAEIVSTTNYQVSMVNRDYSFYINTTNSLLRSSSEYYYAPAQGIKTGTITGVRTLATQARQNGYTYLVILMGTPIYNADGTATDPQLYTFYEAKQLFEWAFSSFSVRTAVERGEELAEIPVRYSMDGDFVRLATGEQFTALLHKDIDVSSILYLPEIPEYLTAPVESGEEVGSLRLVYMEEEIGRVPLITTASLSRSRTLAWIGWFSNEIHSFRAKFIIVTVVLLAALYTMLIVRSHNLKKRRGKYSSYRSGDKDFHI